MAQAKRREHVEEIAFTCLQQVLDSGVSFHERRIRRLRLSGSRSLQE